MRIRLTVPQDMVSAATLGAALEGATRLAAHEVKAGKVPGIKAAIARGVRWRREPPGDESFDPPSVVLGRGWGDCDDLAPWRAGELRVTGEDPGARAIAVRSGPNRWHAVVKRSDGRIEDPSRWAGMSHSLGQGAPALRPARPGAKGPTIVIGDGIVRLDVPGKHAAKGCPMGYAVTSRQPTTALAVREAVREATRIGSHTGIAGPRALALLRALYRFLCQSQDIRRALAVEGLPSSDASKLLALSRYAKEEVGVAPCLLAIGGIAAGVASAIGAVTPIVKAIVDAIDKTAKAVASGAKPFEDLYKQVRAAVDQGTISLDHVARVATELQAQGYHAEAARLRADSKKAAEARGAREFMSENDPDINNPVRVAELKMREWRHRLSEATDVAALGQRPHGAPGGGTAPAWQVAQLLRQNVRNDVLGASYLPSPGPQAVWESLALAYGLDPATALPPAVRAARLSRGQAVTPPPAEDGDFLPPGLDALFARAGAFM